MAATSNEPTIGAESYATDQVHMLLENREAATAADLPKSDCQIVTACDNLVSSRAD